MSGAVESTMIRAKSGGGFGGPVMGLRCAAPMEQPEPGKSSKDRQRKSLMLVKSFNIAMAG